MNNHPILLAGFRTFRKGLGVVQREFTSIHQAALILAFASIIAKILAIVRDRMLASTFGAGTVLDVYYTAFRVPDFVYTLSLFLSSSTALIPIFLEREAISREESKKFLGEVIAWFSVSMVAVGIITFFAMPTLIKIVAPGFNAADQKTATILSQILLFQAVLLGLSNIASTVVQASKRFAVYALAPVLYSLGIIIGVQYLYPIWGLPGIMLGVSAGALFHLIIQLPSIILLGYLPRFSFTITPALKKVFLLSLPRTLGLSFNQFVFLIITAIASTLGAGGIAIFNLSYNLLPLTIIGVSYSIAAFPFLASVSVKENMEGFLAHFSSGLRHIVFWSLPAMALAIVLRAHIVRVILGAGSFDWTDTKLAAAALALFSLSLASQGLVGLYTRAYYAAGVTKQPLVINGVGAALTIASAFLFIRAYWASESFRAIFASALRVSDIENSAILLLPFAYSLGSLATLFIFMYDFRKKWGRLSEEKFLNSTVQILTASIITGVSAFAVLRVLDSVFDLETLAGVFAHGLFSGIAGIIAGILFLIFVKNRELREIRNAVKFRLWKTPVITASEPTTGTEL